MRKIVALILILTPFLTYSQSQKIDSLQKALEYANESIREAQILTDLAHEYNNINIDTAILLANKAIIILIKEKADSTIHIIFANAYNSIGIAHNNKGNYKEAAHHFEKAIKHDKASNNQKRVAEKLLNLGIVYKSLGDYSKALNLYDSSLKVASHKGYQNLYAMTKVNMGVLNYEIGNYDHALKDYYEALEIKMNQKENSTVAILLYNIGLIFDDRGDIKNANKNYFEALKLFKENGNLYGEAYCLSCIGSNYVETKNYLEAINYYNKAYEIHEKLDNKQGMAEAFGEIGVVYFQNKKYAKAREFFILSLNLYEEIGYIRGEITSLQRLGEVEFAKENFNQARSLFLTSKVKADSINDKPQLKNAYDYLSETYHALDDYRNAYLNYKKFSELKDSIFNEKAEENIIKIKAQHDITRRETEIKLLRNQKTVQDLKIKKQKVIIYSVLVGLLSISIFFILLFKQNKTIRSTNKLLAYQKKQITDSIEYASRIQNAILPPGNYISQLIPEHFIFYRPRDIVSGDFYWITEKDGKVIIAVVDCTGHGVPGAFMSMLGYSFLNEIVNKEEDLKANVILNQMRVQVKKSLHQTGKIDDTKDGMDIALCIIDKANDILQFAGAYNSLFLINADKPVFVKGDRMPIGIYLKEKIFFTNHEIKIRKGDVIYMFTDGYVDQFGGKAKKKFRIMPFKELLISVHKKPMDEQKTVLENEFLRWKGQLEQIDDVLVLGLRI